MQWSLAQSHLTLVSLGQKDLGVQTPRVWRDAGSGAGVRTGLWSARGMEALADAGDGDGDEGRLVQMEWRMGQRWLWRQKEGADTAGSGGVGLCGAQVMGR